MRDPLTIKGYGVMDVETALAVAAMVDAHDREGQTPEFRKALRDQISATLHRRPSSALSTARTAASVLEKLAIRQRPDHVHTARHLKALTPNGSVRALHNRPLEPSDEIPVSAGLPSLGRRA